MIVTKVMKREGCYNLHQKVFKSLLKEKRKTEKLVLFQKKRYSLSLSLSLSLFLSKNNFSLILSITKVTLISL